MDEIEKCRAHIDALVSERGHAGLKETSYPSNSLNFFHRLNSRQSSIANLASSDFSSRVEKIQNSSIDAIKAKVKLNIIIAGAGLGGFFTAIALRRLGHKVTIFEKAPELGEIGAGIQIPPNSSRLLLKFGLGPYISDKATEPEAIRIRRWQDGSILSTTKLRPDFCERFRAPYLVIHRASFQLALRDLALDLGVTLHLGSGVQNYGEGDGRVVLENGKVHEADLVVAADGIKSEARKVVLGGFDQLPREAGFAAYRAVIDVKSIKNDPDLEWLLDSPGQNLWIGENRHVMTYTIAGGKTFNMVLSHPEDYDPSAWSHDESIILSDMRRHFEGWDPRLTKLILKIHTTSKWPLLTGTPLPRWTLKSPSPSSSSHPKLLLIGDAAHPMVPYMSSGAAMAVEDGAALASVLSFVTSLSQLPSALQVYERVRILRTAQMQEASLVNGKLWHFSDGVEQRARDAGMKRGEFHGVIDGVIGENPNQWSDKVTAEWTYGYDAEDEVRKAWMETLGQEAKL